MKVEDVSNFASIYTNMIHWTINLSQVTMC